MRDVSLSPARCLTRLSTAGYTASLMARGFLRSSVTAMAALGVLTLAVLPAEHLHVAGTEDGHHADVIHRHWEVHRPAGAETHVAHEDDHATLWLDSPFTDPEVVSRIYPDAQGLFFDLPVPRPQQASRFTTPFVRVSVHDPPGNTSHGLRGPPSLVA